MKTDFKLRGNVLIGLYLRGDVLPWPQNSNFSFVCWIQFDREISDHIFLTFYLCVGFNWRENFLRDHRTNFRIVSQTALLQSVSISEQEWDKNKLYQPLVMTLKINMIDGRYLMKFG